MSGITDLAGSFRVKVVLSFFFGIFRKGEFRGICVFDINWVKREVRLIIALISSFG